MVTRPHSLSAPSRRRRRRGVALIFVLWILILIGLAIGELVARARAESRMIATLKSRAVAQYAAESGILATTAALQSILDSAPDPSHLAVRTRHLDTLGRAISDAAKRVAEAGALPGAPSTSNAQYAVAVLDLNARLDLARADTITLRNLFAEFTGKDRAHDIVAALRQSPVTRFGELARVPGVDDALALAVAPYITVWSDGLINVNSAPEAVIAALPGVGPSRAQALVARRDAGELFTTTDPFRPAPGSQTTVPVEGVLLTIAPTRIMVVSRGWQRGSPLTHEIQAVYLALAGQLTLQSWEERDR